MERLLILNPGSTSTKVAVYDDDSPRFLRSIPHTREELAPFPRVADQLAFRRALVLQTLAEFDVEPQSLTAIVSRGGMLGPIHAGAYEVNDDMVWQLTQRPHSQHASNVGALIAHSLAAQLGIPAYIYDGITVDEMTPINKLTGLPGISRGGMGHNLNTRAIALRYCAEQGRKYSETTVIAAHLGGGITVNLHHNGRIEEVINDESGSFSPERVGTLPIIDLVQLCYSGEYSYDELMAVLKHRGGLLAHLGTTDSREVERRIAAGDEHAKLVYDAMALGVAKNIARCAPVVCGRVDAILLTGGIAHSEYVTGHIREHVGFIAPVLVYPGEDEMLSLALGGLRVLRGEEAARTYTRMEHLIF